MGQILSSLPSVLSSKQFPAFREKALRWANQHYDTCCYLTSNGYETQRFSRLKGVLAIGVHREVRIDQTGHQDQPFLALQNAWQQSPGWWFGGLAYDLKNAIERLSSEHPDGIQLPELYFFQPLHLIHFSEDHIQVFSRTHTREDLVAAIQRTELPNEQALPVTQLQARIAKTDYLNTVEKIREHIKAGDIYELNFCQEFFAENYHLADPVQLFEQLNHFSEAPFAGFFKWRDCYLCCASPERFLQKKGKQLIAQPIKGTIGRGIDPESDAAQSATLFHSEKDRAENVMIVDLVRNDLAKSCQAGTVQVEELFGIYRFPQVYQMISTVTGVLRPEVTFADALRNAFPMGSMTGAPKVMSMKLIEAYERSRRGWYAGAIGYIDPKGDFDFNVVIRSLQYQASQQYLSFQVGGAIVYDSVPEKEYEECLLKAKGILRTLAGSKIVSTS